MFKVQCPDCDAPYQVDERRVPPDGIKMRCPKCGSSFHVARPQTAGASGPAPSGLMPAAVLTRGTHVPHPPAPMRRAHQATMLGVAPSKAPDVSPTAAAFPSGAEGEAPLEPTKPPETLRAAFRGERSSVQNASSSLVPRAVRESTEFDSRGQGPIDADLPAPRLAGSVRGVDSQSNASESNLPMPRKFSRAKFPSAIGIEDDLPDPIAESAGGQGQEAASSRDAGEAELDLPSLGERIHGVHVPNTPANQEAPRAPSVQTAGGAIPRAARPVPGRDKPAIKAPPRPRTPGTSGAALPAVTAGRMEGRDLPSLVVEGDLPDPAHRARIEPKRDARKEVPPESAFDLDLDVSSADSGVSLPEVASGGRGRSTVKIPSKLGSGGSSLPELDLPSPADSLDLGADGGEWELPSPGGAPSRASAAGLPAIPSRGLPATAAGLPATTAGLPIAAAGLPIVAVELPSVVSAGLPENAAGLPGIGTDMPILPKGSDQSGSDGSDWPDPSAAQGSGTEAAGAAWSASPAPDERGVREEDWGSEAAFGEVNAGGDSADDGEGFGFDASLRAEAPDAPGIVREAGGGTSFGEVNLRGESDGEGSVDLRSAPPSATEEDMEFGAIPQERTELGDATEAPSTAKATEQRPGLPPQERARRQRRGWLGGGALLGMVVIGGAALSLVPALGPYGAHYIIDTLNRDQYRQTLDREVLGARRALQNDTFGDYSKALAALEAAIGRNPRLPSLVVYAAFVGELAQLRFGADPEQKARADVRLSQIEEQDDPYLPLAHAARAASDGEFAKARKALEARASRSRLDAAVLVGELELAAGNAAKALRSWEAAESLEKSARSAYGMARSMVLTGDLRAARGKVELTLNRNPKHLGAQLLRARTSWQVDRDLNAALDQVEAVTRDTNQASPEERVQALTLLGNIHLEMSHISAAEAAYAGALKLRPQSGHALAGLGDALFRAGRYSEALARFEAAAQADPNDIMAAVGAAKTKIALEKLREASAMLKKLREAHAKSALVHYWYGRAEEALGNREEAEKAYRDAVNSGEKRQAVVEAYVALALLMNQQGRRDDAQSLLLTARAKLGESAEVHKALGQLSFSQGRYDEALDRFRDAAKLDSRDLATKFYVGSTLSRLRSFDEAAKAFDEVAAIDRDFPGLALERGLLYESSGRGEEALKMYESALAKAPNDPDLMLRVGCGNVLAGRFAPAIGLLSKVLTQKPQSAETNHCLGRAMLLEGRNLAEALRYLNRAVELDPHRSEYYLYVGWAANEAGRVSEAEKALKRALELDQGLADAYWQRGVLRYRQGAVKDALADLLKALELRPSRAEARAALADTYYDLGREGAAMEQWRLATGAQPDNATWRFRYGRLLAQNRSSNEARSELRKALELAEAAQSTPRWVWEAHRLLARAIGRQSEAIPHWEAFLRMAPQDNAYRDEAKAELRQLGKPWDGL